MSPFCRKVRLVLGEKRLAFETRAVEPGARDAEIEALNPAGEVPLLIDDDAVFADGGAIVEYLDERYPNPSLLPGDAVERAEMRRLAAWFDTLFHAEVTRNLVGEKVEKRLTAAGAPDSGLVRLGIANLRRHLAYIDYLADRRNWLAGADLSLADIAAAAQLSTVDYIGDVPWDAHPGAHDWYARVKSRPSFRPLLEDRLAGLPPAKHYADLDF